MSKSASGFAGAIKFTQIAQAYLRHLALTYESITFHDFGFHSKIIVI
jgi:hypothetical protein